MDKDWVDDEGLSREETLKRFEALNPQPTRGPGDTTSGRVSISSDSPFVITSVPSEATGTSQQIDARTAPAITISGENARLLAS